MRLTSKHGMLLLAAAVATPSWAGQIQYEYDINYVTMNQTGANVEALAIAGQIPGPVIRAKVGDTLSVTFHNKLKEATSIHWHGVLLPNEQDGVPFLTTPPILPGSSWTYTFDVTHSGTYWYHSHSGLQEQRGLYGALVFYPQQDAQLEEQVLVFSDWSDEHPNRILANLKKSDDYYALKKNAVQSWYQVFKHGSQAVKNRLMSAWSRMGAMDISDVGYDAFLVNGQKSMTYPYKKGSQVRLRLVNASASTYFKVQYAGPAMKIVAADGVDVEPFEVNELTMAIAETYDVVVQVPETHSYELKVSAEDGTGYASAFIGEGSLVSAPAYHPPNLYLSHHGHHGMSTDQSSHHAKPPAPESAPSDMHAHHQHHMPMETKQPVAPEFANSGQGYQQLRALQTTTFPTQNPVREVTLHLTGFMERYFWSFNNQPLSAADKILIKKGETVRFILKNDTMMHHPIHLHGHFFRVINQQGDKSPLKHTVNVPAMGEQVIEFAATEDKDWFFHCHNLYHMKSGMSRIISYGNDPELSPYLKKNLVHDDAWFGKAHLAFLSNMTMGEATFSNHTHALHIEYDSDWEKRYDVELYYEYYATRFLGIFAGGNFERAEEDEPAENVAILGIHYTLPLLIESELRLDSEGHLRFQVGSHLQLFKRVNFEWMVNTDKEYQLGLNYEVNKHFLLTTNYDSDYHFGAGVQIVF